MLASDLIKICCRLWFLVSKHVPLIPHMKPRAAKEVAASEGNGFVQGGALLRLQKVLVVHSFTLRCCSEPWWCRRVSVQGAGTEGPSPVVQSPEGFFWAQCFGSKPTAKRAQAAGEQRTLAASYLSCAAKCAVTWP